MVSYNIISCHAKSYENVLFHIIVCSVVFIILYIFRCILGDVGANDVCLLYIMLDYI